MPLVRHTPYQLVLFDFDGVLADTAASFLKTLLSIAREIGADAAYTTAAEFLPQADSRELMRRVGIPLLAVPPIRARLLASWLGADRAPLVPGVTGLLQAVHDAGVEVGVISARPLQFVRAALGSAAEQVRHFGCSLPMLTKAERISMVLHTSGHSPDAVLFVGDEVRDLRAAEENAIACALVGWGFGDPAVLTRAGAAHFIESVAALRALLLAPTPSPRVSVLEPIPA